MALVIQCEVLALSSDNFESFENKIQQEGLFLLSFVLVNIRFLATAKNQTSPPVLLMYTRKRRKGTGVIA